MIFIVSADYGLCCGFSMLLRIRLMASSSEWFFCSFLPFSFFFLPRGAGSSGSRRSHERFHLLWSNSTPLSTFFLRAVEVANGFSIVFPVCIWIVLICFWMVDEVILWSTHLQGAVMDLGQCFSTLTSRYRSCAGVDEDESPTGTG